MKSEEIKQVFDGIMAAYGGRTQFKIKELCISHPGDIKLVRRYGNKVGHGEYDLSEIVHLRDAAAVKIAVANTEYADAADFESLIPELNPLYVPFGCYRPVLSVMNSRQFCPIYIVGDSGNGKTLGIEQAAHKANRELISINITNETTEEDLIGTFGLEDGNTVWKDGPVLRAMRRGAVLALDEIDQATPRIMCLQTILQNKPVYVKKTNELVYPADGFTIVASANTRGDGDGLDRFAGGQILNEALLERFNVFYEQEYPSETVETKILKKVIRGDDELVARLVKFGRATRAAYIDGALTHFITTRRLVQIAQNMQFFPARQAVEYAVNRFDQHHRDNFIQVWKSLTPVTADQTTEEVESEEAEY